MPYPFGGETVGGSLHAGTCHVQPAGEAVIITMMVAAAPGRDHILYVQHRGTRIACLLDTSAYVPSCQVRNLCRLSVKVDAFITSWQFPAHQIDFGGGPADEYCCVVRPTPPWQAAVLPSRPAEGGAQLLVTVPASAVEALKRSPVLQQLVPNASFL